jgi:hypothetical protein
MSKKQKETLEIELPSKCHPNSEKCQLPQWPQSDGCRAHHKRLPSVSVWLNIRIRKV